MNKKKKTKREENVMMLGVVEVGQALEDIPFKTKMYNAQQVEDYVESTVQEAKNKLDELNGEVI